MLYAELNLLCILILMLLAAKLRYADKSIERFFLVTLMIGQSGMFFFDTIWVLTDSVRDVPPALNYGLNICYFACMSLCPYLTLRYIRLALTGDVFQRKEKILLCLPVTLVTLLAFLSVWTGWAFSVSEQNVFQHGPLYALIYMPPLIYMLVNAVCALVYGARGKRSDIWKRAVYFAIIIVMPVIAALVDFFVPDVNLVCAVITISMVSVIFDYQQSKITKDTLTQLSNRYDLMLYLEDQLEVLPDRAGNEGGLYVMFADVDYFKRINDTYGHLEGDHALCHVADALRHVCLLCGAFPARISGDEFVAVFSASDDVAADCFRQEVKDAVSRVSETLPYTLALSAGLTRCTPEDKSDIPALLNRADAALYEEKHSRPVDSDAAQRR